MRDQSRPAGETIPVQKVIGFLLLHAPLMMVFSALPLLATVHSLLALAVGLHYLVKGNRPAQVTWVIAYIAGAEILWRGANAALFWEYGKYAMLLLSLLLLFKYRMFSRIPFWTILFLLLLLPGILVMPRFDREAISFQLAGMVSMAVLSMTFASVKLNKVDLQRLFLAVIAPTVAMGLFVAYMSLTQNISYSGGAANEQVTGGIGANQVTSALSLGAIAAFYYIFLTGRDRFSRFLMIGLMITLVTLSVLTFSRAGLWNTAGAVAVAVLIILRRRSQGINVVAVALIIGLISYYVVLPFLTNLTGGALRARFSDFDTTDRDVLVKVDYQVFLDHPVFGVGVGQSLLYHVPVFGYPKNTHTEYGRLLAEHGSFGVALILILVGVTFSRLLSRRSPLSKSMAAGFTVWALLYMTHAATRLVAPSFAFGFASACFLSEEEEGET